MAIDPSLFGQTVSIPSANSMLNPAPAASSYSSVHSSLSGLPDSTTLAQVPLPSSFSTGTGTGGTGGTSGTGSSGTGSGTVAVSPYAPDVTDADVQAMTSSMSSLQGVYASGDLANLSSITTSMTSQVVGQTPTIPSGWLSQVGTTSSLTSTMGTPNALSLLSSQQSSQALANQIQGNTNPSNPQTCGIAASITGAISSVQSGLSSLYQGASSAFQSVEQTIGSTVSSATSMVTNLISSGSSSGSGGSGGSGGSSSLITKAQINSITSDVSSSFSTISTEVTGAISTVVKTVDGMAVSIENQIKLGVANAINSIKSDPCFGSLASLMTGSALGSVLSAQTGLDNAKAAAAAQQAQQKQNANTCASIQYDYPGATSQNTSDIQSQISQCDSDYQWFQSNLVSAQTAFAAAINSAGLPALKNNQNSSAAALTAYQQAKQQLETTPQYTTYQAAQTAATAQSQALAQLTVIQNFMNTKGQLPSNPNGPWYTAANTSANPPVPGTVNGTLP
jgi:hypothetical protein